MKKLFTILLILTSLATFAKTNRQIDGTIKDTKNEALAFANVFLFRSVDSTLYKATSADLDGKFLFEDLADNTYYLKISAVGYVDYFSKAFTLDPQNIHVSFHEIVVEENANMLEEVKVVAKKPFIEQQIDKTVINVENSISGSGSTALEILEKAPGVTVDRQNDQIKIRNKAGVQVMIDGKLNYMSAQALSQYLNNMPSDQIQSIEVITNPSSKYDAAGNSGIINIKLKRNKNYGTNGTVSVSGGTGIMPDAPKDLSRSNLNLNLNHRNKNWNIFGSANGGRATFYNDNTIVRSTTLGNTTTLFDQYSQRSGSGNYYSARLGADYFLNDKTTIGLQGDISEWNGKMSSDGYNNITTITNGETVSSKLIPLSTAKIPNQNYSLNASLRHKFNENGKEMSIDLDHSMFNSNQIQNFSNEYLNANNQRDSITFNRLNQPTEVAIYSAKIDFVIPSKNKMKYEFGAKTSFVNTDNNFKFENKLDNNWELDLRKTNHFQYTENVNAAYINSGYQWKKWGVQAGLRIEHTHSNGHSLTTLQKNVRNYIDFFPTVFVTQSINDNNAMRYSYSRRIDRPNYQQLNPFIFFLDPYTYQVGNPYLQPQYTDSYEATYTYKHMYSVQLAFADTRQMMFQVLEQNDETKETYQTDRNLKGMQNYSANFSIPVSPTKWWNMQNNIGVFYNHFKGDNVSGANLDAGKVAYNIYTNHTFTLPKKWSAEASMWYNSPNRYGIIEFTKPQYAINGGIMKSFLNDKAKLKLSVNDLFLTSLMKGKINYSNMNLTLENRWVSRRVALTFTYNFGNQNVKGSRRATGSDDLKRRISTNN